MYFAYCMYTNIRNNQLRSIGRFQCVACGIICAFLTCTALSKIFVMSVTHFNFASVVCVVPECILSVTFHSEVILSVSCLTVVVLSVFAPFFCLPHTRLVLSVYCSTQFVLSVTYRNYYFCPSLCLIYVVLSASFL